MPNTPVHFPLAHNTMPLIGGTSYLDRPEWGYKRLKGYTTVKRGDIVVFNFPAGDTVALNMQNPDYYTLVEMFGRDAVRSGAPQFGEVIYRPVDRRENYVKRCVALPGDTIAIHGGDIYIDGVKQTLPADAQYNYIFQVKGAPLSDAEREKLGIRTILNLHGLCSLIKVSRPYFAKSNMDDKTITVSSSFLPPNRRISMLSGVSVKSVARLP